MCFPYTHGLAGENPRIPRCGPMNAKKIARIMASPELRVALALALLAFAALKPDAKAIKLPIA